jgi:histidine triad (HIT) family protein
MVGEGCPFCSIASGEAPASIVYEDDDVLVFMDLSPTTVGHTLVVPREHWENIYEVPEETLTKLIAVVKRISVAVKKTVGADGIMIIQNNGRAAGQVVFHLHFHVIPASSKSGVRRGYHGRVASERARLDETAQKIRENL